MALLTPQFRPPRSNDEQSQVSSQDVYSRELQFVQKQLSVVRYVQKFTAVRVFGGFFTNLGWF